MFLTPLRWWVWLSTADALHWRSQVYQGRCYIPQQLCLGWWKLTCFVLPWLTSMLQFQHMSRVSGFHLSHQWCILEFPSTRTAWAFGKCATACTSKHVVSAPWLITSLYSCASRSSGSTIWANVDRSWWPIYFGLQVYMTTSSGVTWRAWFTRPL